MSRTSKEYFSNEPPGEGMGFIYTLSHPITQEIRYIGLTERSLNSRFLNHKNSAKNDRRERMPIQNWILKLLSEGLLPLMEVLEEVSLLEINEKEIQYIADGRLKYSLLNVANGGKVQGREKGWKPSQETLEKLRKSARKGERNNLFFNYVGTQLGKLTVIQFFGFDKKRRSLWGCICECGNNKIINIEQVQTITSCGCARKDRWTNETKAAHRLKVANKIRKSPINGRYEKITHEDTFGNI